MFFRGDPGFRQYQLFESRCAHGRWQAATSPSFAASPPADEADPAYSADGRRLYFVSTRDDPRPRGEADLDIWQVGKLEDGRWGEPVKLPGPVNSPGSELLPRPQPDGSLVFGSDRQGGLGGSDIYRAWLEGGIWRVENLGEPVNSVHDEYEAEVSRDGRHLIVVADRGDRSHLYPYRRERGAWIAQPRIVPRLEVFQVGPLLSPAGDRLLFAQADGSRSGRVVPAGPGSGSGGLLAAGLRALSAQPKTTSRSFASTCNPGFASTSATVPSASARTLVSIFMASMVSSRSPLATF